MKQETKRLVQRLKRMAKRIGVRFIPDRRKIALFEANHKRGEG